MGRLDRYGEPQADDVDQDKEHACSRGWIDEDNARPCRICRPWHFACRACGTSSRPACPHTPPSRKGRTST